MILAGWVWREAGVENTDLRSGFIKFAPTTAIEKVPSVERWLHEITFDGYRVHLANEAVKVITRRGND